MSNLSDLKFYRMHGYPHGFLLCSDGQMRYRNAEAKDSGPICERLHVRALAFDETGAGAHGIEVEFSRRLYGKDPITLVIRKAELARDPAALRERLMDAGITISTDAYEFGLFLRLLNQMTANAATVTFSKQGWHDFTLPNTKREAHNQEPETRQVYISPLGHLITDRTHWPRKPRSPEALPMDAEKLTGDALAAPMAEHHARPCDFDVTDPSPFIVTAASFVKCALRDDRGVKARNTRGTYRGWQREVAAPIFAHSERLPHLMLGLASGCAGTVLDFVGEDSSGLNWIGKSSTGKSASQYVGASTWANPKAGEGVLFSARNTDNRMEFVLAAGRGASVHIDEAKTGNAEMISGLGFMLASGIGKGRLTKDIKQRDPVRFDGTFATLSSEFTIEQLAKQAGVTLPTGATVRMPSIDTSDLPPVNPGVVDGIKAACLAHYGHVGPRFAAWLAGCDQDKVKKALDERLETLTYWWLGSEETTDRPIQPSQRRAWRVFALLWLVLDLMYEADILTYAGCAADGISVRDKVMDAIEWGFWNFNGTGAAETLDTAAHATDALLAWLQNNPAKVRFIGDRERAGFDGIDAWYDQTTVYLPTASFAKLCGLCGTSPKVVIGELKKREMLQMRQGGWTHHKIPSVGLQQHYRITFTIGAHSTFTDSARAGSPGKPRARVQRVRKIRWKGAKGARKGAPTDRGR